MSAEAARILEPERENDSISLRTQKALRSVGATGTESRRKTRKTAAQNETSREQARKRANLRTLTPPETAPKSARAPTHREGAPPRSAAGPKHPSGSAERGAVPRFHRLPLALAFHSRKALDRHTEEEARAAEAPAPAPQDLPIETGRRVFLEQETPPVRERSEEEIEKERQAKQLDVAKQLFVSGVPETTAAEMSGRAPEGTEGAAERTAPAAAGVPRQVALQTQLQAVQTQARLEAAQEAEADESARTKRTAADNALGRLRFTKALRLILTEAAAAGTVVAFFIFIFHANLVAFGSGKVDFPPFVYKNVKIPLVFKVAVALFDVLLFVVPLVIFALSVALLLTLVFAAVHFNIIVIIYRIFASLFGG